MRTINFDEFWEYVLLMWFIYRTRIHVKPANGRSRAKRKTSAERASKYLTAFYTQLVANQGKDDLFRIISIPSLTQFQFKLDNIVKEKLFPNLSPQQWKCYTRIFREDGAFSNFVHDTDKGERINAWESAGSLTLSDIPKKTLQEMNRNNIRIIRPRIEYLGSLRYGKDEDDQYLITVYRGLHQDDLSSSSSDSVYTLDVRKILAQRALEYVRKQMAYSDQLTAEEMKISIANSLSSLTSMKQYDAAMELLDVVCASNANLASHYVPLAKQFIARKEHKKAVACFDRGFKYLPQHIAGHLLYLEYLLIEKRDMKKSESVLSAILKNCSLSGEESSQILSLMLNSNTLKYFWPMLSKHIISHPGMLQEFIDGWKSYFQGLPNSYNAKLEIFFSYYRKDPLTVLMQADALIEVKREKKAKQICRNMKDVPDCLADYYARILMPRKKQKKIIKAKARGLP